MNLSMKFKMVWVLFFLVVAVNISRSDAAVETVKISTEVSEVDPQTVEELHKETVSINPSEPDSFSTIAKSLADAKIIGLGEGSHGAAEFHLIRNSLFKTLVSYSGFSVLGVEMNSDKGELVDSYILTGKGNPVEALNDNAVSRSKNLLELVEWMKEYNLREKSDDKKLRFFGFDTLLDSSREREQIYDAVKNLDSDIAEEFKRITGKTKNFSFRELTAKEQSRLSELFEQMKRLVSGIQDNKIQTVITHYLDTRRSSIESEKILDPASFTPEKIDLSSRIRDQMMADRIVHLSQTCFAGQKMLLYGHNLHIQDAKDFGEQHKNIYSVGWHLKRVFGQNYLAIGSTAGQGRIFAGTITADGRFAPAAVIKIVDAGKETLDGFLGHNKEEAFFIDLRKIQRWSDLGRWFYSPRLFRNITAVYSEAIDSIYWSELIIPNHYDGIFFIKTCSPRQPLNE